jgi:lipoyl(octanoyl) transferase
MSSPPTSATVTVLDWGRTAYEPACRRQAELVEQRMAGAIGDTLVFTEHDPVYTIGLRSGAEANMRLGRDAPHGRGHRHG